jgi:hypothetical protein
MKPSRKNRFIKLLDERRRQSRSLKVRLRRQSRSNLSETFFISLQVGCIIRPERFIKLLSEPFHETVRWTLCVNRFIKTLCRNRFMKPFDGPYRRVYMSVRKWVGYSFSRELFVEPFHETLVRTVCVNRFMKLFVLSLCRTVSWNCLRYLFVEPFHETVCVISL